VYRVDKAPDVALHDPELPKVGSTHEWNGHTLTVRAYGEVKRVGPGYTDVQILSDNDGSTAGPPINPDSDETFKDYNITQTRVITRVPAFILYWDILDHGDDVYSRTARWEPYEFNAEISRATLEVSMNLPRFGPAEYQAIAKQNGRLHIFPNLEKWRFLGARTHIITRERARVTYSWEYDAGVPGDTGAGGQLPPPRLISPAGADVTGTPVQSLDAGTLLLPSVGRPPWWRYRIIPSQEVGEPPNIGLSPESTYLVVDAAGYNQLPGHPIP
jgi:hypothetical protein